MYLPLVTARRGNGRLRLPAPPTPAFWLFSIRAIELRGQGLEVRQGKSAVFVIIRRRILKASPDRYLRFQPREGFADTIDRPWSSVFRYSDGRWRAACLFLLLGKVEWRDREIEKA